MKSVLGLVLFLVAAVHTGMVVKRYDVEDPILLGSYLQDNGVGSVARTVIEVLSGSDGLEDLGIVRRTILHALRRANEFLVTLVDSFRLRPSAPRLFRPLQRLRKPGSSRIVAIAKNIANKLLFQKRRPLLEFLKTSLKARGSKLFQRIKSISKNILSKIRKLKLLPRLIRGSPSLGLLKEVIRTSRSLISKLRTRNRILLRLKLGNLFRDVRLGMKALRTSIQRHPLARILSRIIHPLRVLSHHRQPAIRKLVGRVLNIINRRVTRRIFRMRIFINSIYYNTRAILTSLRSIRQSVVRKLQILLNRVLKSIPSLRRRRTLGK